MTNTVLNHNNTYREGERDSQKWSGHSEGFGSQHSHLHLCTFRVDTVHITNII